MPYARNLEDLVLPSPERILTTVRRVLGRDAESPRPAVVARRR